MARVALPGRDAGFAIKRMLKDARLHRRSRGANRHHRYYGHGRHNVRTDDGVGADKDFTTIVQTAASRAGVTGNGKKRQ
jgi:hypothetical protein